MFYHKFKRVTKEELRIIKTKMSLIWISAAISIRLSHKMNSRFSSKMINMKILTYNLVTSKDSNISQSQGHMKNNNLIAI